MLGVTVFVEVALRAVLIGILAGLVLSAIVIGSIEWWARTRPGPLSYRIRWLFTSQKTRKAMEALR